MAKVVGYFVEQNVGAIDRTVRVLVGAAMLGVPYFMLMESGSTIQAWQSWLMVLSVYPFLTGILGTDPLYRVFGAKTCDLSARNRCGTYPFQVDALVGHQPTPEDDFEHSLTHSTHKRAA
ncbi:MAG: DUF2892 domain-containing protein [Gammaproteobacteria bacterium]|nr:DUF2892 domain-containing protein [Gammaproteobacteria bacterium]